jgi:octaprenyl-diphosphate synthase
MRSYGMKLGTVYQIYDDCLDLVGDEKAVGKTLRTDLIKGKLTLPMLYLLMDATPAQKTKLSHMLLQGEPMDISCLASIADYEGAIERAIGTGQELLHSAVSGLQCLPDSTFRQALTGTAAYLEDLLNKCRVYPV